MAKSIISHITADYRKYASVQIANTLLNMDDVIYKAEKIFIYISFDNEVLTDYIISKLNNMAKLIAVPKIINGNMYPVLYSDKLIINEYGIAEPEENRIIIPDTAIIPALLFDINKNRLGRGKAYYDRFLAGKTINKIGIAYDCQIFERLPADGNDIKMDKIVTEKRIIL